MNELEKNDGIVATVWPQSLIPDSIDDFFQSVTGISTGIEYIFHAMSGKSESILRAVTSKFFRLQNEK